MQENSALPLIIAVILGLALYGASSTNETPQEEKNLSEVREYGQSLNRGTGKNGEITLVDIEKDIKAVRRSIQKVSEEITSLMEEKNRSPYAGTVMIKTVSGLGSSDPKKEYATISLSSANKGSITITGWKLQSLSTGKSITIGEGTLLYDKNITTQNDAVVLIPGDTAIINSGVSPVGYSFKINKCTGYLNQFNSFSPSLPQQCPDPADEDLSAIPYTPANYACYDFIERLSRCRINTKPIPVSFSSSCVDFIAQKATYQGCVSLHRNDKDFYGREWRVYLSRNESLWRNQRETIQLLDENDKVVYTYTRR